MNVTNSFFFSCRETVHDNKDSNRRNSKCDCGSEIPILSIFIYARFQEKSMKFFVIGRFPSTTAKKTTPILDHHQPNHRRIPRIPSWDTADFWVLRPEWPRPFLTTPTAIFFNQFLICTNLYEHSKNQVFSSFCSRVDLKILRYD